MVRIKKILGYMAYNLFARYLPLSNSRFSLCSKKIRYVCAKLMLSECGKNVNIERMAMFSTKIKIGDNSGIGVRASVSGACTIGDNVMMGPDCIIYSQNHRFDDLAIPMNMQGHQEEKPVTIGDDVWIGGRVIIVPGVKIGSHSIIGAGSVVTKDVPDWAIVAGNPAKVKKYRNKQVDDL